MTDPAACGRVPAAHAQSDPTHPRMRAPGAGPHAARPTPPFTAEHERLRVEIREFIATRLRPHADEWEAAEWFPDEAFGGSRTPATSG